MIRFLIQGYYYGVRGLAHSWIKAFLSNRKQEVVLEGHHSIQADVLSGVQQGTVLGPLLYLAYINDLPDSLKSSDARLFADDSLLYLTVNGAEGNNQLQKDLSALEECTIMRITSGKKRKKRAFQRTYTLHSQVLEVTDTVKYPGVKVSDDLT